MKTKMMIASLLLAILGTPFKEVHAQGSLTPPGAPAPTMKTLDQLEPRTPISTATNINQSGSYYLTADLVVSSGNGIGIYADEVTLDLNGFTIRSTAPSATGYGIYLNGTRRDIAIANGFIAGGVTNNSGVFSGSGFQYGIYASADPNVRVSSVSVSGCRYSGIYLSDDTTVAEGCTVRTVGSYGIYAGTVKSSVAEDCGYIAISGDQVGDCRGKSVGGYGISATTVHNSYGYSYLTSAVARGISATTVGNSYGYGYSGTGSAYGISATTVENSYGYGYSDTSYALGISATTVLNSYGLGNGYGSSTACGISANSVQNSYGYVQGDSDSAGYGIDAYAVGNCRGYSGRNNSSSRGIAADGPVDTCYAYCSYGTALEAESASNCRGESNSGYGIDVDKNAINSVGISSSSYGIRAYSAENSYGTGTRGISATTVSGCRGSGSTDDGISASTVDNSYGYSTSGNGIDASNIQNCYGSSSSSYGIIGTTVNNSSGSTSTGTYGIYAGSIATGCTGTTGSGGGCGLYSSRVAIGCYGYNSSSGTGIYGYILNSCRGTSVSGTPVSYSYKYNMP